MNILFVVLAIIEVPLVALFLKFYWPDRSIKSFTTKVFCSLIFVVLGIIAAKSTGNNTLFAEYMIWGLALGMAGDLLLHALTKNMLPFILGVVAFLVGHIFYIIALQKAIYTTGYHKGVFTWYEILIVAVVIALALVYAIKTNVFKRKGAMAYGLLAYGVVLATMLAKAVRYVIGEIAFGVNDNMFMVTLTIGLGAILFVLSDMSLGIILSSEKELKKGMRIFNITTYYAAQVLLAASIFFVFSRELY